MERPRPEQFTISRVLFDPRFIEAVIPSDLVATWLKPSDIEQVRLQHFQTWLPPSLPETETNGMTAERARREMHPCESLPLHELEALSRFFFRWEANPLPRFCMESWECCMAGWCDRLEGTRFRHQREGLWPGGFQRLVFPNIDGWKRITQPEGRQALFNFLREGEPLWLKVTDASRYR